MAKGVNYYDGSQWVEVATVEDGSGTERPVKRWDGSQWVQIYPTSTIPDSGLSHHYDATKITASDGDSISTWADQEGSDDLTAGTAPTYKTNVIGGNPVVRHDGVDDYLDVAFGSNISGPYHLFWVGKFNTIDSNQRYAFDGGSKDEARFSEFGGSDYAWYRGGDFKRGGTSSTNATIWTCLAAPTDELRVNGTQAFSGNTGSDDMTGLTTGRRTADTINGDVDIGELIIYSSELSDSDRNQVESYLSDKWGVAV